MSTRPGPFSAMTESSAQVWKCAEPSSTMLVPPAADLDVRRGDDEAAGLDRIAGLVDRVAADEGLAGDVDQHIGILAGPGHDAADRHSAGADVAHHLDVARRGDLDVAAGAADAAARGGETA